MARMVGGRGDQSMFARSVGGAWRQMDNWFNSQGVANQQLMAAHQAAAAAFGDANVNYYQGMASLSATAAVTRLHNQAQAKNASLQNLINAVGSTVNTVA
jgi:hypothetical protein